MDGRDRTLEVSVDDAERSKRTRIRHGARSMKCERIREREGIEVEREDALRRFILAVVSQLARRNITERWRAPQTKFNLGEAEQVCFF